MSRGMRQGLWVGILGALIGLSVMTGRAPAAGATDFSLELFDGKRIALKDLRGKAVLVNFWAAT